MGCFVHSVLPLSVRDLTPGVRVASCLSTSPSSAHLFLACSRHSPSFSLFPYPLISLPTPHLVIPPSIPFSTQCFPLPLSPSSSHNIKKGGGEEGIMNRCFFTVAYCQGEEGRGLGELLLLYCGVLPGWWGEGTGWIVTVVYCQGEKDGGGVGTGWVNTCCFTVVYCQSEEWRED